MPNGGSRNCSLNYPLLYSLQGYRYCDLLLSRGRGGRGARPSDARLCEVARSHNLGSRHRARHPDPWPRPSRLGVCRSWRTSLRPRPARDDARTAARLDEAVEGLRASGQNELCPSRPPRPRRVPPRGRRLGWRETRPKRSKRDRRTGINATVLVRLRARRRAARAGAARGLRAAQRPRRAEPAAARLARPRLRRRRSERKRGRSSTSRASSSPNAATTAATRNSPSSTPSSPAAAASPTCRPASEARRCHRLGVVVVPAGRGRGRDRANPRLRVETSFRSRSRLMFSGGFI